MSAEVQYLISFKEVSTNRHSIPSLTIDIYFLLYSNTYNFKLVIFLLEFLYDFFQLFDFFDCIVEFFLSSFNVLFFVCVWLVCFFLFSFVLFVFFFVVFGVLLFVWWLATEGSLSPVVSRHADSRRGSTVADTDGKD